MYDYYKDPTQKMFEDQAFKSAHLYDSAHRLHNKPSIEPLPGPDISIPKARSDTKISAEESSTEIIDLFITFKVFTPE